jgi:hypothetical protein
MKLQSYHSQIAQRVIVGYAYSGGRRSRQGQPTIRAHTRSCNADVICIILKSSGFCSLATEMLAQIKGVIVTCRKQPPPPFNLIAKSKSKVQEFLVLETATAKLIRAKTLKLQLDTEGQVPCPRPTDQFPYRRNQIFRGLSAILERHRF